VEFVQFVLPTVGVTVFELLVTETVFMAVKEGALVGLGWGKEDAVT
jgi:hypothetical protein